MQGLGYSDEFRSCCCFAVIIQSPADCFGKIYNGAPALTLSDVMLAYRQRARAAGHPQFYARNIRITLNSMCTISLVLVRDGQHFSTNPKWQAKARKGNATTVALFGSGYLTARKEVCKDDI